MITDNDAYVSAVASTLRDMGFDVYVNSPVEGLSGLKHVYDVVAMRSDRMVCISVRAPAPTAILLEMAKSLDVRAEILLVVTGDLPREVQTDFDGKRFKMLSVKSPEELVKKLGCFLH